MEHGISEHGTRGCNHTAGSSRSSPFISLLCLHFKSCLGGRRIPQRSLFDVGSQGEVEAVDVRWLVDGSASSSDRKVARAFDFERSPTSLLVGTQRPSAKKAFSVGRCSVLAVKPRTVAPVARMRSPAAHLVPVFEFLVDEHAAVAVLPSSRHCRQSPRLSVGVGRWVKDL